MSVRPIRVLLVDDHETMLWGLERLIEGETPRMVVVGKAGTAAQALRCAAERHPDVVLLDLDLGVDRGIDVVPRLLQTGARVVVLTGVRSRSLHKSAVLAGARGFVSKGGPAEDIIKAIEWVQDGKVWLDRSSVWRGGLSGSLVGSSPREHDRVRLTPREQEIVRILATEPGMSIVQIARQQHISERTLRNQLTSIYSKLGLSSRLELNVYASNHQFE